SPNLGLISAWILISECLRISLKSHGLGVVPPITRLPQSSSRVAPPLAAASADSTESTHASKIKSFISSPPENTLSFCTGTDKWRILPLLWLRRTGRQKQGRQPMPFPQYQGGSTAFFPRIHG